LEGNGLKKTGLWTVRQAAIALGLSGPTVRKIAGTLGLGWRTADGRIVLSDEDVREIGACDRKNLKPRPADPRGLLYTQAEAGRVLGVTKSAVKSQIAKLGIGVKAAHGHATWLTEEELEWLKRIKPSRGKGPHSLEAREDGSA